MGPRGWGFPLSSISLTQGRRCQECGRVDSGGTQSSLTYVNINATFPPSAWGQGRAAGWWAGRAYGECQNGALAALGGWTGGLSQESTPIVAREWLG